MQCRSQSFIRKLVQRAVSHFPATATRDVVQAVEPPKFLERMTNGPNCGLRSDSIRREAKSCLPKVALGCPDTVRIAPNHSYVRASRDKRSRCRKPQASGAADDDKGFAGKRNVLRVVCCVLRQTYLITFHVSGLPSLLLLQKVTQSFGRLLNGPARVCAEIFAQDLAAL